MSDPLVTPDDLAVYLNEPTGSMNTARALAIIADVQTLCENILAPPLPAGASVIIKRVSLSAYVSMTSSRQKQMADAGALFGPGGMVALSDQDETDLRRLGGGTSGVLSVSILPADYAPVLPIWDVNGYDEFGFGQGGDWGAW